MESNIVQNLAALKHLPSSWSIKTFDEIVKDVSGGNKKTLKSDFLDKGEFLIVDQGQSLIAGYTNNKELLVKAKPPYVVFGDHTRAFKYVDVPFAMGADGTKVLKPKIESILIEKYLYYFFLSLEIPNTGYNRHFKYLKELKIPLPPLAEQQKIAAILDAADSLRQKDQQLVERYTALSQSLFLEMFGDPVTNPMGWETVQLNKLCSFKKVTIAPENIKSGTKYLALEGIEKESGEIAEYKVVENGELKSNKFYFDEDTILYGKLRPYLNKVALPNFNGICSTEIIPIKPISNQTNKFYIVQIMRSAGFVKFADENSSGANLPRINPNELEKYKTIQPPIDLQTKFAERIKLIEEQKQQVQRSLEQSEALFNSLLQRAFTGELTAKMAA